MPRRVSGRRLLAAAVAYSLLPVLTTMSPGVPFGPTRLARWSVLAITLATAVALVVSAWSSVRAVARATATLQRGQGEPLLLAVQRFLREQGQLPSVADLERLIAEHAAEGLRYVGLVGPGERIVREAGVPLGSLETLAQLRGPIVFVDLGERVRMRLENGPPPVRARPLPGGVPGPRPPGLPLRAPGPTPRLPAARPPQPAIVIELEPVVAAALERHARRVLVLSSLAAAALLGAAGFLWRLLGQRESAARRLEHERRLQALGQMSAVLAHELRNPLASLKGHAQLLAERLPEAGREHQKARRIVAETARLEALSQALLDFCRSGPAERRPVDPAALVREAAASVDEERLELDTREAPVSWPLDALRLHQALANVLRNARQASPAESPISTRIGVRAGRLEIAVADRGEGLPAGCEEKVFEPFFTRRTRGTGLGLALARSVAEMHGGTLVARNLPGGGAEFCFSLAGA